jgi:integrase
MSELVKTISQVRERQNGDIESLRFFILNKFPYTVKALEQMDIEYTRPKRRKGFNMIVRETKKYGRRIYVRLSYKGKTLPTKFNTHTGEEKEAELYVLKNKDRLIQGYLSRKDGKIYKTLESFYKSEHDNLSEGSKKYYYNTIKNKLVPFLQQEKIKEFGQITRSFLIKFQDALLKSGIKNKNPIRPQSVNNTMKAVRDLFGKLARQGVIEENPCDFLRSIPVKDENKNPRGCYELEKIQGVFCRKWKDELSYLLCSLIYSTGMRNSEIKRLKLDDMQLIDGCRFIKIEKSKTKNGIRLIPLHKSLYEKIKTWSIKNDKRLLLFNFSSERYSDANRELARRLKVGDEELERENITFYSGRHYWKTLMSAEGLGEDIEEIWMGHKVSGNVAKLYNHRDKQGRGRMVKKAKQVFSILDRCIFKTKP